VDRGSERRLLQLQQQPPPWQCCIAAGVAAEAMARNGVFVFDVAFTVLDVSLHLLCCFAAGWLWPDLQLHASCLFYQVILTYIHPGMIAGFSISQWRP
jgi:hypothetical protein